MDQLTISDFKPKPMGGWFINEGLTDAEKLKSLTQKARNLINEPTPYSAGRNLSIINAEPGDEAWSLHHTNEEKEAMISWEVSRPISQLYVIQSLALLYDKIKEIANSSRTSDLDFLLETFGYKFGFDEEDDIDYHTINDLYYEIENDWSMALAFKEKVMPLLEGHSGILSLFEVIDSQAKAIEEVYWKYIKEYRYRLNRIDKLLGKKRSNERIILEQLNRRIEQLLPTLSPKLISSAINDEHCSYLTVEARLAQAHARRIGSKLYSSFHGFGYTDSPQEYSRFLMDLLSDQLFIYSNYDIFNGVNPENDIWDFICPLVEIAILNNLLHRTPIPNPFFPIPDVENEAPAPKSSEWHSIISSSYSEEQVKKEVKDAAVFITKHDNTYAIMLKVMQEKNRICVNLKNDGFKAFATLLMDWKLPVKAQNIERLSNSIRNKYRKLFDGNDTWRRNSEVLAIYKNMQKCFP